MADNVEKINEFLAANPVLEAGESFVAVAKGMPLGQIKRNSQRQGALLVGGAIGAVVSHIRDSKQPAEDMAGKMRLGVFLVLTDRRLLLVSLTGLRSTPGELLATVQRSRIVAAVEGTTKVSFVKMMTLTFEFDDETSLVFEFPKVDAKEARHLLELIP